MVDITNIKAGTRFDAKFEASRGRFEIEETYWGYIVRPTDGPRFTMQMLQAIAMLSGASFAASSLGLLILPDFLASGADFALRLGAAIVFAAMASFLLWYASRGTQIEYHIDTSLGEIRETVRNRSGRPTRLGSYGFDAIGGVYLDRSDPNPKNAALVLRFGNTSQTAIVAQGTPAQLAQLKDRLGQDLIIGENAPS